MYLPTFYKIFNETNGFRLKRYAGYGPVLFVWGNWNIYDNWFVLTGFVLQIQNSYLDFVSSSLQHDLHWFHSSRQRSAKLIAFFNSFAVNILHFSKIHFDLGVPKRIVDWTNICNPSTCCKKQEILCYSYYYYKNNIIMWVSICFSVISVQPFSNKIDNITHPN